jgi:hypothetical protein
MGKKPLVRPMHRWENNIKMDLTEIGYDDVIWIHVAQNKDQWQALVNTVMNLSTPLKTRNLLNREATICLSRWTLLHGVLHLVQRAHFKKELQKEHITDKKYCMCSKYEYVCSIKH